MLQTTSLSEEEEARFVEASEMKIVLHEPFFHFHNFESFDECSHFFLFVFVSYTILANEHRT